MRQIVLVVILVLAACGQGESVEVRPFEEIQASDVTFENDPTFPGRAIMRVTTTEPAICAIVWGETETLGQMNNSLDMNGTGIIQHDVLLPGAEAGQTYFYRLQGSTADGTLFQSGLMTFTLPAADPAAQANAPGGTNLALEATITDVSSEFSDSWAAGNAIDGDLATEWSTAGDGDEGYIVVDLGQSHTVAVLEFMTRSMADGSAVTTTYTVTVDGSDPLGPFAAGNPADRKLVPVSITGREFRFDVQDSTGGNTGAIEIGIYEQ